MANLGETFNANDHEEPLIFDPLPPGEYVAQVVDSEIKDTKAGTGKYVKLQWQIIDGQYTNRVIFANYNIINPNPKAQEIGEREFAAACRGVGKTQVSDTEELHAVPCIIKLKIEPEKNGYGPSNRIAAYKPAVMQQGAAPVQQAAPVQHQAPPQQQQPAPAAGKPVWMANG